MIDMVKSLDEAKAKKIGRSPCKSNRSSSIGHWVPCLGGCLRQGVYERTKWEQKELHDLRAQRAFDEGHDQEQVVLRDLAAAGVRIIEQQSSIEYPDKNITGHLDGIVVDGEVAPPVEIKSMHPNIFDTVNSWEDMLKSDYPWVRAYTAQITLYMLLKNIDHGYFLLKNKSSGEIKQINVPLDYDLGEACLKTAEEVNGHVKAGTIPDRITDRETCKRCGYKTLCLPDVVWSNPIKIADDPDFEKRVDEHQALKPQAARKDELWEIIKERCKATAKDGELDIVVGKWHITGKEDKRGALRLSVEWM